MRKKVFLETDEYDIFIFPVPESVLKGNRLLITLFPRKRVKEWVLSWMQRLHPCFDGRFMHDIKFFKEKGSVMALVTVAEKMKVASHLVKKNTAVYVYRPDKRRVFSGNVSSRRFWLASVFALVLVMVSLSGFAFYSDSRIAITDTSQMPSAPLARSDVEDESPSEDIEPACNTLEESSCPDVFVADVDFSDVSKEPDDVFVVLNEQDDVFVVLNEQDDVFVIQNQDSSDDKKSDCTDVPKNEIEIYSETEVAPQLQNSDFYESHGDTKTPSIFDTPKIDSFISLLIESGCRISSFHWQTEPSASAVIFVEGCFPEDVYTCVVKLCGEIDYAENYNLPQLLFSSISYSDNVPSFSIILDYSCFDKVPNVSHFDEISASVPAANPEKSIFPVQSVFRKLIVKTGGNVISESMEPPFVSGSIPYGRWNEFSEEVSRIFDAEESSGLIPVAFCADGFGSYSDDVSSGESSVSVSMSFDSNRTSFFPLEKVSVLFPIHKNAPELSEQSLSEPPLLAELDLFSEPEPDSEKTDMVFVNLEEIGHICMGGNMYMSFYRNEDGTIVKGEAYERK